MEMLDLAGWHPIAASSDLPTRHVFHGQLLGREFAVWRADDGFVNVWENRCLHRGVRLSLGLNDGRELRCLYHGWRYSSRSAGCTYIPAHPADAPARTICNRTYDAVEAAGMVWSSVAPEAEFALPEVLAGADPLVLRPVPVNAAPGVALALAEGLLPDARAIGAASVSFAEAGLVVFVQPLDAHRCVLRGVLLAQPDDRMAALRYHDGVLCGLRDRIEASGEVAPPPLEVGFQPVDAALAEMPARARSGPKAELRVQVARKWDAAQDVAGFQLRAVRGVLPAFQPGAHIDVHLPNGMSRQYSITNAPGESDYTIGVKRDAAGRGGSVCLHGDVREGDVLAISAPRNNFPLRRDSEKVLLIAGGIGITPMLAMAQALQVQGIPYALHVFARSEAHVPFADRLAGLAVTRHLGLDAAGTGAVLGDILSGYAFSHHVYVCGPAPMLTATREIAAGAGWPEEAVHFEYFANPEVIDDSTSFEIALARSAMTLQVPAGRSILEVLQENGVDVPSSCEQGACGTCVCGVLEGEPEHQDVYLSAAERAANDQIMTCVSRARSARLVLDI